jgi:hypothetical protein
VLFLASSVSPVSQTQKSRSRIVCLLPRAFTLEAKERGCLFKFKMEHVKENDWWEGGREVSLVGMKYLKTSLLSILSM